MLYKVFEVNFSLRAEVKITKTEAQRKLDPNKVDYGMKDITCKYKPQRSNLDLKKTVDERIIDAAVLNDPKAYHKALQAKMTLTNTQTVKGI